jgi:WD40 repeat protein
MRSASPYNIDSIVFSPDGRFIATQGFDGGFHVKIWDYSDNRLLATFDEVTGLHGHCDNYPMAFTSDGKLFAFEQKGKLCPYDTDT